MLTHIISYFIFLAIKCVISFGVSFCLALFVMKRISPVKVKYREILCDVKQISAPASHHTKK